MNEPASTPTLAGLWKVFCIIAERTPPNQLIWLALMLCVFSLVLVWLLTYAGLGRAARSKQATAPTNYITDRAPAIKENVP